MQLLLNALSRIVPKIERAKIARVVLRVSKKCTFKEKRSNLPASGSPCETSFFRCSRGALGSTRPLAFWLAVEVASET